MRYFLLALLSLFLMAPFAAGQDPLVAKAVARIAKAEAREASMKDGDIQTANRCTSDLNWAQKRLNAVVQKNSAEWKGAVQRLEAVRKRVQAKAKKSTPPPTPTPKPAPTPTPGKRPTPGPKPAPAATYDHAKLVQLNKEVGNAWNNLKIVPARLMADQSRINGVQREIAGFRRRLAAFPAADPNVKLVTGNLNDFEALLNGNLGKLNQDQGQVAGIEKRMESIRAKYDRKVLPGAIDDPFHEGQIRAWAKQIRQLLEKDLPADLVWLNSILGNAALKQNSAGSMASHLRGSVTRGLYGTEKTVRERIAGLVFTGMSSAEWILETDPKNRNHVLNRILGKGDFEKNMARLHAAEHGVTMAAVYDDAMAAACVPGPSITDPNAPRPAFPNRAAQSATIKKAILHLQLCVVSALHAVRMPEAVSTDSALLKIAAETLRLPKYEVAGWKRMVISSNKKHRERREGWIKPGTSSATISLYTYAWDEFQVTTAEEQDGELWVYSNTLKHYTSGDSTTSVGEWILSSRYRLTRILQENLEKPPLTPKELKAM